MQDSAQLYKWLVSRSQQYAIFLIGTGERIESWNIGVQHIFGYSEAEFVGSPIEIIFVPEDVASGKPQAELGIARKSGWSHDRRWHRRKDGSRFFADGIVTALKTDAGKLVGYAKILRDATHEHEAAEELRRTASKLEAVLESTTDGVMAIDADWRISYINMRGRAQLSGGRELIGEHLWSAFPGALGTVFEENYRTVMSERTAREFEAFYPPLHGWFEVHAYPSPEGMVVYFRNITERKAAEQRLRLLQTAVSNLNDAVVITEAAPLEEPGPRIVYVNEAFQRITGYPADQALGRSPRFLQGEGTDRAALDRIAAALRAREPVREELINYTHEGKEYNVELEIVPLLDGAGAEATHFVAVERDVSERRKLEARLRQAQRMEAVGRLAGGIAHDFNNLLTVIGGYGQLLRADPDLSPRSREKLDSILRAADRASLLTQQLLAFSRRQIIQPRLVNLNAVIKDTVGMLQRLIGEDIRMDLELDNAAGAVRADPSQLEQVLVNLAVNARDAMPEGGTLAIRTAEVQVDTASGNGGPPRPEIAPGLYVLMSVQDTGVGIAPAHLALIFEPFFTTKPMEKGTGLGLATVYGIVKQTGGEITVESRPGEGTTFSIYFPRASERVEPDRGVSPVAALPLGTETILLVEDEQSVRALVREMLTRLGYEVLEAGSGAEALGSAGKWSGPIDLLLTDMIMPEMSGRALAEQIVRVRPEIRVLYMSGYSDDDVFQRGLPEAEGGSFLHKPFTTEGLAKKIRETLDRRK